MHILRTIVHVIIKKGAIQLNNHSNSHLYLP